MSQALITQPQEDKLLHLAEALSLSWNSEEPPSLEETSRQMEMPLGELVSTLNNPDFLKLLRGIMKAKAHLAFHKTVVPRLLSIAHSGTDREALTAAKLIGQLTNDLKSGVNIDIKMSFEELRQLPRPTDNPLFDLMEIRRNEQNIIDAEEDFENE